MADVTIKQDLDSAITVLVNAIAMLEDAKACEDIESVNLNRADAASFIRHALKIIDTPFVE
jgi:hypothetical protein